MNDTTMAGSEDVVVQVDDKPIALVYGKPVKELPQDLYIPPDALEVILEAFEGPLDLLLYLIRRQNIDILNLPIAEITRQYMNYVELMKNMQLELAAEYLVMAAMLAEIKSRMMLPRPPVEEEEGDPRAELIRRLQEYERYKMAAEDIDNMPRAQRDYHLVEPVLAEKPPQQQHPDVEIKELVFALRDIMSRAKLNAHHHIKMEPLSVRERMSQVLSNLKHDQFTDFTALFNTKEGVRGVVVTFLAVLELIKASLVELVQNEPYGPIHVKAAQ